MSNIQSILLITFLSILLTVACKTNNTSNTKKETTGQKAPVKQSIVSKLKENSHLSIEDQIALYKKLKKETAASYDFENEDQMTMYGYGFLWANQVKEAIAIFKLIVEEFPDSYNAYDSLGEGYLRAGDLQGALLFYRKSLQMNPDNFNAEDQIEAILYPDRIPETPAQKFVKTYPVEAYLADLDQLAQKLVEIHPSIHKFISSNEFTAIVEAQKAKITEQTTLAEFRWLCNEIVASVRCSHTGMGGFFFESQMLPKDLYFPLQTHWTKNQLFVTDPINNSDQVAIQDEITHINGVEVGEILANIYRHIPTQGQVETTKKHVFNDWSAGLIAYALGFPEQYTIQLKDKPKIIALQAVKQTVSPKRKSIIKNCDADLCFEVLEDQATGILSIQSFNYYNWNNFKEFTVFMDQTFGQIKDQNLTNLIIDLRNNGGGAPEASVYLLRYLAKAPFPYFPEDSGYPAGRGIQEPFEAGYNGELYFLIDGNGQSTTGHFMAVVKELGLGTIVGEELGSNHFCTAGQAICRLKNTKVEFYVANAVSRLVDITLPDNKGILPDHYVEQGIEDYLNGVDAVKEFALNLIKP